MSAIEKLIVKVFRGSSISFNEAKRILLHLGYQIKINGSHHKFIKDGFTPVVLKRRTTLLKYQINYLQEALQKHGYEKEERKRLELLS